MTYIIRINRPLIDNKIKDIEVDDRESAAIAVVEFLRISRTLDKNFEVLDMEKTETELKVFLTDGTIHAFPKGAH